MKDLKAHLSFDALGVGAAFDFSLEPLVEWWGGLKERNKKAREAEEVVVVALRCPACGAGLVKLTTKKVEGKEYRICRGCGHVLGLVA